MTDKPITMGYTPAHAFADGLAVSTLQAPAHGDRPYGLRRDVFDQAGDPLLTQWARFQQEHSPDEPMHDPEWLRGYFEGQTDNLLFYSLYQDTQLCGAAPFLRKNWPLSWTLGRWTIREFPLVRLRLLGERLGFPEDDKSCDLIFSELCKSGGFDALYFEGIPVDSFIWQYLHRSDLIRKSFLLYEPTPPSPRLLLRLEGSFDQYMGKFSAKHRKNLLREVKRLREGALGEMRLVRFDETQDVPAFLDKAVELSRKTYQWKLYQRGLSATDLVRKRMLFAASHGWLRSYLLFCGDRVCAFVLGFQYGNRFLLDEIGFDPELSKYSVGTVIQLLAIEDLFLHNRPQVVDFQSYGKYKEVLSTESYPQGKVFLFRRGLYSRFLRGGHQACRFTDEALSKALDRFSLKGKLKQRIRGWSSSR